ncbi:MAG: chemotaxis response regulator protein-glutamate methylesterase [Bdellovibrionales bacterium]
MNNKNEQIHVMLVDDSAVIRGALKRLLESISHIKVVESVNDGNVAVNVIEKTKPHIVILDVEMPIMDGITALPQILQKSPHTKVIMFSSLTEKGATVTLDALRLGAVECIVKPSSAQDVGPGSAFQKQLISLIESLVPNHARRASDNDSLLTPASTVVTKPPFSLHKDPFTYKGDPKVVAIGSSTGGPQALFDVLKHCQDFPVPIAITQHMPATFTTILAQHIKQQTSIEAMEGENGMVVKPGHIYVAPGDYHMLFEQKNGELVIVLDEGPPVNFCKPAVDPMLNSLLDIYGQKVLSIILTGMGHDGLDACKRLVDEKGRVIAQDEETSVVWGMPGAVAQANICSEVLPLDKIGPWIRSQVMG